MQRLSEIADIQLLEYATTLLCSFKTVTPPSEADLAMTEDQLVEIDPELASWFHVTLVALQHYRRFRASLHSPDPTPDAARKLDHWDFCKALLSLR